MDHLDELLAKLEDARDIMKAMEIDRIQYPVNYDEIIDAINALVNYGAESRWTKDLPTLLPRNGDTPRRVEYRKAGIEHLFEEKKSC